MPKVAKALVQIQNKRYGGFQFTSLSFVRIINDDNIHSYRWKPVNKKLPPSAIYALDF